MIVLCLCMSIFFAACGAGANTDGVDEENESEITAPDGGEDEALDQDWAAKKYYSQALIKPFWIGNAPADGDETMTMTDETVTMVQHEDGAAAYGTLAYAPTKILRVQNYGEDLDFTEGTDYVTDGRKISRVDGSVMSFLKFSELIGTGFGGNGQPGKASMFPEGFENPQIFYSEGPLLVWNQLKVTYEFKASAIGFDTDKYRYRGAKIPTTIARLKKTRDLRDAGAAQSEIIAARPKILFYGDSVATGCNSSSFMDIDPFMPSWPDLVLRGLESYYGTEYTAINTAVGGKDNNWGLINLQENVIAYGPDLVFVHFGLNDGAFNVPASDFYNRTKQIIEQTRAASSKQVDFVLYTSLQANQYWEQDKTANLFPPVMRQLAEETSGVVLVDIWAIHEDFLQNKFYADMLANNINHPNDFLVRVYAMATLAALIESY
ncbi:hypothetical protein FACS1894211_04030 [Clostridia bacterium]|nr:hypothetical protein FACS1894211_04030 [Clostridia bacterium]